MVALEQEEKDYLIEHTYEKFKENDIKSLTIYDIHNYIKNLVPKICNADLIEIGENVKINLGIK